MESTRSRPFLQSGIFRQAYLGKQAEDLTYLCEAQIEQAYQEHGVIIPICTSSTLHSLSMAGKASMADLAKSLQVTHQITAQRVRKLDKLGLIQRTPDPNDTRRIELSLTAAGREQAQRLERCMEAAAQAYADLFEEIGVDLSSLLLQATEALHRKPLGERISEA